MFLGVDSISLLLTSKSNTGLLTADICFCFSIVFEPYFLGNVHYISPGFYSVFEYFKKFLGSLGGGDHIYIYIVLYIMYVLLKLIFIKNLSMTTMENVAQHLEQMFVDELMASNPHKQTGWICSFLGKLIGLDRLLKLMCRCSTFGVAGH